jgi:hypothetical protein
MMKRSKKSLPKVDIISYGKYTRWNDDSRNLPELEELTHEVVAEIDIEFGMIIEIGQCKGRYLEFIIHHPPFKDKYGNVSPSFEGEYQIKANPYRFFLGDTVWEPVEDKKGTWEFIIKIDQEVVAQKRLELI